MEFDGFQKNCELGSSMNSAVYKGFQNNCDHYTSFSLAFFLIQYQLEGRVTNF